MTEAIRLTLNEDELELNGSRLIYRYRYPETEWPEYDTIRWPLSERDRKRLMTTLLDCVETGELPVRTYSVLLPDGTEFRLDGSEEDGSC